jgi:hypothetical protein
MNEISSGVAFWILGTWRKMDAQLQLSAFGENLAGGSRSVVQFVSPKAKIISLVKEDTTGQKGEWKISVDGCRFFVGVPGEDSPLQTNATWSVLLAIEFPTGKRIFLAERPED